jgi:hypothetical protein
MSGVEITCSVFGPLAGIMVNLHNYYRLNISEQSEHNLYNICDSLIHLDQSNLHVFPCLTSFPWHTIPFVTQHGLKEDLHQLQEFLQALEQRNFSIHNSYDRMDENPDDLCTICCANRIDCKFSPCGHQSCSQ